MYLENDLDMPPRTVARLWLFFCFFCVAQTGFAQVEKTPIVPFYDTLFYINANIGSFSAEERAASITDKIRKVGKEHGFDPDAIMVKHSEGTVEIVFNDMVIMGVTPADAQACGKTPLALANEYKKIIGDAIVTHIHQTSWQYILMRVALVILVIVVLFFLIKFINKLFRLIFQKVEAQKGKRIKSIKIKSFILMAQEKATKFIVSCINMIRYAVIALLVYLSLPFIFSIFPPTRGIADKLFGYVLNPVLDIWHNVINYIPNLITIIVIVLVFRYLVRGLRYLAEEIDKGRLTVKGFYPDWAYPTFSIIKTLLYAFMFVVIFPFLPHSNNIVFQGVSVFIGILFSIGSTSVISNMVSGLVLTYMRSFKVGDRIKIGDIVGNVVEKTPFVTRIRTAKNEEVTIPNSSVMSAQTFNFSQSAKTYGLILHTEITYNYETPWRQVHQLLLEAAARTPDAAKEPKPFVLQTALDDFYVEYQINIYITNADKTPAIYSDLNQNIQDVFNEAGLDLMTPHAYNVKVGGMCG